MINRRQLIRTGGAAALTSGFSLAAWAQGFDTVKVLVGFAPGGANDLVSRSVATKMGDSAYAKTVIVENRTGAGGQIACTTLKNAAADGATLLCSPFSCTAIYPHVYKSLPYDALTDFATVSTAASFSLALAVGPMVPASVRTLQDYVAWVKADLKTRGGYGHPGAGTAAHFVGALLALDSGLDMVPVSYRGSSPLIADTVAGQIPMMLTGTGDVLPFARSGKLRVLATSGTNASPFLPDVPTFVAQSFPKIVAEETIGFYVPAKTPRTVIAAANRAVNDALKDQDVIQAMAGVGLVANGSTPEAMSALLRSEHERWGPLIKRIGFTVES